MKRHLLMALLAIVSFNCYSQIKFEKGYFIDNEGKRIESFIKNNDWKNNPKEFEYKLAENSETLTATIENIQEFSVDYLKFKRFAVKIDRSGEGFNDLSKTKDPEFIEETLFLKSLIEGKANLYSYEEGKLSRFFFNVDDAEVTQLIHKSYQASAGKIGKNDRYKQQLAIYLQCESLGMKEVKSIEYKKDALIKYFVKYNKCVDSDYVSFEEKHSRDIFNLNIRPGLSLSSLSVNNIYTDGRDTDFGYNLGSRMGVEMEFILPYNKNKWAIVVEPTYQSFKTTKETELQTATVDYKSIELPLGIRHYFFLNEGSKIFMTAAYVFDFSYDSYIEFSKGSDLEIKTRNNLNVGLGYNYRNKYSLEFKYGMERDILQHYIYWLSGYNSYSLIFGYKLF